MAQTFSHTADELCEACKQAPADELCEACKHVDAISCDLLTEYFVKVKYEEKHGELSSIRVITTGPAIKHTRLLEERMNKFDFYMQAVQFAETVTVRMSFINRKEKRMGYTVLKGDPRYKYFAATMHFGAGPSAVEAITYVPVCDMGPPEHVLDVVMSVWEALAAAL